MDNFKVELIAEKVEAGHRPANFVITKADEEGEFRFSDGSKFKVQGPAWGPGAERKDAVTLAKAIVKCGWAKQPKKVVDLLLLVMPGYTGELFPAPPEWDH